MIMIIITTIITRLMYSSTIPDITTATITTAANATDFQADHSPDNVKFPDGSLTVHGTPPWHRHVKCY